MAIIFKEGAFKQGYSEKEMLQIVANGAPREIETDNFGNPQISFVGFTDLGVFLEVLMTYLDNDVDSIYHCDKPSNAAKKHYESWMRDDVNE